MLQHFVFRACSVGQDEQKRNNKFKFGESLYFWSDLKALSNKNLDIFQNFDTHQKTSKI